MEFPEAIVHILAAEGGYSNNPKDPGGETRYGITKRTARTHGYLGSMRTLPMATAARIYKVSYWDACQCGQLPPWLRLAVFDAAVHSGPAQSVRWLQQELGVPVTGRIGPETIAAAAGKTDCQAVIDALLNLRLAFLQRRKNWRTFKNGWTARIEKIRKNSLDFNY